MSVTTAEEPALLRKTGSASVTWRSFLLGTIAVVSICSLTPINDFTFSNTSLTVGFIPLALVLVLFVLVVVINAPLHRWFPKHALNSGELAVVLLMSMMACSLSNWGLTRFFIPTPASPFHLGATDETYWKAFVGMDLPKWLFPVQDLKTGRTSEAAKWFYAHVPEGEKIPFRAWLMPLFTWGIFLAAMFATLVAIARLTFEQWIANERLPFPLVQVQTALLESPRPGKALNAVFRSPAFWIGFCAGFGIHALSCLNTYFPKNFPKVPLGYDFYSLFSEGALFYLSPKIKKAALSFTVIGVTYFIRSRVAFSLWISFFIANFVDMQYGMRQGEMPPGAWQDQHLGACIAFIAGIFWVGRHHWARVLKSAIGMGSPPAASRIENTETPDTRRRQWPGSPST